MTTALVEQINELTEAISPASAVVAALRKPEGSQVRRFETDVYKAMRHLGEMAAEAAEAEGGILIEANTANERRRITAILAKIGIPAWFRKEFRPAVANNWRSIGQEALKIMAAKGIPIPHREKLIGQIYVEGGRQAGLIDFSKSARVNLFRLIDDAKLNGWGPDKLAREIQRYVPAGRFIHAGPKYRASLIARTETMNANRVASLKGYRDSPVVKKVIAFDGDGDAECIDRNGRTYTFDQADSESAATHPQCVLSWGPVT